MAGLVKQIEKREGGVSDGYPTDQRDAAHRVEQEQPPSKKTSLEDLLSAPFGKPAVSQPKYSTEIEMDMYKKDTSIPLICGPLKWWKENAQMYPFLSPLAKAYLTVPATSVPSELIFFLQQGIL